jgi:hypothetical protein
VAAAAILLADTAPARDFVKYATNNGDDLYYDQDSVGGNGQGMFSYISIVRMAEENAKQYSSRFGYKSVCYTSMQVMSVDCTSNSFAVLKIVDTDGNNAVMGNTDIADPRWAPIANGSPAEKMRKILCR